MNTITPAERLDARAFIFQSQLESEINRIVARVDNISDSEFSDERIAALYSEEIAAATKKAKMWKDKSTKGSRPVAYEVQKELKKRLEALLGGLDNALSDNSEHLETAASDAPVKSAPTAANPWVVLTSKFTPLALDKLLFDIGLLENAETQVVKENVKPQVWVAVMEALRNKKLLSNKNKKAVAEAFIYRYGEIGSVRSLQRPYEPNNVYARKAFDDTWELVC